MSLALCMIPVLLDHQLRFQSVSLSLTISSPAPVYILLLYTYCLAKVWYRCLHVSLYCIMFSVHRSPLTMVSRSPIPMCASTTRAVRAANSPAIVKDRYCALVRSKSRRSHHLLSLSPIPLYLSFLATRLYFLSRSFRFTTFSRSPTHHSHHGPGYSPPCSGNLTGSYRT
jgi:hypothetical protein